MGQQIIFGGQQADGQQVLSRVLAVQYRSMVKFYVTTAIPYVNARPHLGHALEYVQADVIRRYHRLIGDEVHLVSGADENALKNVQAAEKAGVEVKTFLERNSDIFRKFYADLGVELNGFRRGTDEKFHWPGVQELWKRCNIAGDIYKKTYKGLYCVGCEQFYLPKDLVDGKCPAHLKEPEEVAEENYFFKLTRYQKQLEDLIESNELNIIPEHRRNEVLSFVKQGLEDFSISRSNQRARKVGVPIPGDDSQKVYVWFDALTIYMTAVGYGYDEKLWNKWWPADLHIIGKDIIRFHCVYWPAMLLSAGLPLPRTVFSHGFITSNGQKMSKTIGNVIDPYDLINKYGVDALRYYLLREIPPFDDGDITLKRFAEVYQADLANGLGNLVQRVAKMGEGLDLGKLQLEEGSEVNLLKKIEPLIQSFKFNEALEIIWREVSGIDKYISRKEIWALPSEEKQRELNRIIHGTEGITGLRDIAEALQPFMPETAERIREIFQGPKVVAPEKPLFPRLAKIAKISENHEL